jgi:hypothetical protein
MYILFFAVPLIVWVIVARLIWKHSFSTKEMIIQSVPTVLVITTIFVLSDVMQTSDSRVVNGTITSKEAKKESCPIGWVTYTDGHCTEYRTRQKYIGQTCTTTNGKRTCTNNYRTEYNYYYPWEKRYYLYSEDLNSKFEIRRVDSQGTQTPPRFARIEKGAPASDMESYTNYIGAADSSVFYENTVEPIDINYPSIKNQFELQRVIFYDVNVDSALAEFWNETLSAVNTTVKETEANVIIVVTSEPRSFSNRLTKTWRGHKINDVVVTIGVNDELNIKWSEVNSWSKESLVNIKIRDEIQKMTSLDPSKINKIIETNVLEHYQVQPEEAFEYLAEDIKPPMWVMIMAFIVILIISPIATFVFVKYVDI